MKTYPLWSAKVAGVDASVSYKYVQLNKAGKVTESEKTMRKLPAGSVHTPNEFFGSRQSIYKIPMLPQAFENKLVRNSPFFREGANENVVIENVKIELAGHSTREYAKLAYHLKFPEATPLLDLTSIKLRSGENDETMIREKLYVDLLNNIGVPVQQKSYIRMFWNGVPIDLFVAMEVQKENWTRKALHPDIPKVQVGSLWKMKSCCEGAGNLEWKGPTIKNYNIDDNYKPMIKGQNVPKDNYMADLIALMKDLKDYDPSKTKDPVAYWEKRLDLDVFLKSMVMDYLTAAFDAYWIAGSNYQIYHDPVIKKWVWLPMDIDDTSGHSFWAQVESYKKTPRPNKKGFESFLVTKLILDPPTIKAKLEDHLKTITSYIFKPQALNPRVDAYIHMIEEDVVSDRKLPRVAEGGKYYHFKLKDLYKGAKSDLKDWVKERSEQIQKDMKFKSLTVVTNRVPPHDMHPLQLSVYGIKP
ncbi:hypothetical protein BG006_001908 [Podila minutissima]|uniref:Spore coat protein CotH n=1 Tax=Podila minutissima TaxID=64525 RepID=A0A9P5SDB9_9FUNG|nr:hypothetical protein BG006_001908 [Podila minutissima]